MKNKILKRTLAMTLCFMLCFGIGGSFAANDGATFMIGGGAEEKGVIDDDLIEFLAEYIKINYFRTVSDEELRDAAYQGIFEALDKHSKYFTKAEYDEFMIDTDGTFGGIGISIQEKDDYIEIIAPIEGTPGERIGLKSGDLIVEINGTDVKTLTFEKALNIMRGDPGTLIQLGIRREGSVGTLKFDIIREIIKVNPVKYEIRNDGLGYLRISQFNGQASEKVKEAVAHFIKMEVKGVIVDLRGNPGGYLDEVIEIADYFMPKDLPIIHEEYNNGTMTSIYAQTNGYRAPLAVLVDEGSASASEIFAGAIKDNKLGTLVGTKTYGKGTVQTTRQLNSGAGLKLTIAEYLTAGKIKINGKGIEPDVVVERISEEGYELSKKLVPMIETKVSKVGMRGLDIYGMQQRLRFLGYDIDIDGVFGTKTAEVLKVFQKKYGIGATGILDGKTEEKLVNTVEAFLAGEIDLQLDKAAEILQ